MNENFLGRIGRFCFHLNQLPEEVVYPDIQEVGVALVITEGAEMLQNSLLDRRHPLLELLSESVRLHSEGVQLRQGLAPDTGKQERERVKLGHVLHHELTVGQQTGGHKLGGGEIGLKCSDR